MKKVLFFVAALLFFVTAIANPSFADSEYTFKDVSETHWAKDEISSMVQLGVIEGYANNTFQPDKKITREEFAKLITSSFYLDLPPADEQPTFVDISVERWSFAAIEAAKDFLTGYYPPSGKAFFDPKGMATREDVAVALVKILGYQPNDLINEWILNRFRDEHLISPNVKTYIALAVENKLMVGDHNKNFNPEKGLTRSEAAVLLYRAIKGAVGDGQQELKLNVSAPETISSPSFYITGDTANNAKVYINNKEVEVTSGQFRIGFRLSEEGAYTYKITARIAGGKSETITKKVTFQKGAPSLEVTGVPEKTSKQVITVNWKVKDDNDAYPTVYVNGKKQSGSNNSSSTQISLEEGVNEITVEAENAAGKTTKVVKKVIFTGEGPQIVVQNVPNKTDKEYLTLNWTVTDANDNKPYVYLNDQLQYGSSSQIKLKKGSNVVTFKAVNKFGKVTEKSYTVVFENEGPTLKVNSIAATTDKQQLTISWTVNDQNDYSPIVTVNNSRMYDTQTSITLKPGLNTITVKATNSHGDSTEETLTVSFEPPAPTLTLKYAPETTNSESISLSWTVDDLNDYSPIVYVNDKVVSSNQLYVTLVSGKNTFKFVASNKFGKNTELIYNVTYNPVQ
ncbi:S-layer homology domain-containing protein [Paenibacillus yanchengensis]|uniref:S-layer homology domain-containing protein n=1 Tax=Paenibacillus yanchengensis TaxID=2035833 RepID=A0ABW4YKM4_9BACL